MLTELQDELKFYNELPQKTKKLTEKIRSTKMQVQHGKDTLAKLKQRNENLTKQREEMNQDIEKTRQHNLEMNIKKQRLQEQVYFLNPVPWLLCEYACDPFGHSLLTSTEKKGSHVLNIRRTEKLVLRPNDDVFSDFQYNVRHKRLMELRQKLEEDMAAFEEWQEQKRLQAEAKARAAKEERNHNSCSPPSRYFSPDWDTLEDIMNR